MKVTALILSLLILGACSQNQNDRAREQAHQTAEQIKHDSRVAAQRAAADAAKASREVNRDLDKAREEARRALDTNPRPDEHRKDNPDNH